MLFLFACHSALAPSKSISTSYLTKVAEVNSRGLVLERVFIVCISFVIKKYFNFVSVRFASLIAYNRISTFKGTSSL